MTSNQSPYECSSGCEQNCEIQCPRCDLGICKECTYKCHRCGIKGCASCIIMNSVDMCQECDANITCLQAMI